MRNEPYFETPTSARSRTRTSGGKNGRHSTGGWLPKITVFRDNIVVGQQRKKSVTPTPLPAPPLVDLADKFNVRAMTPRQMVDLSFDLYIGGFLDRQQYQELAFQPELMPNYEKTIGALTGEPADPDRPRDYTAVWRARLAFESAHADDDDRIVERTQKILMLLEDLDRTSGLAPAASELPARATSKPRRRPSADLPPALMKLGET